MVGGPLCLSSFDSFRFVTITPRMLPTSRAMTTMSRTTKASAQTGRKPHTFCFAIVFHFFSAGFSDSASAASPLRTGSPLRTESVERGDVGSMGEMVRFSDENSGLRVARPIPPAPEAVAPEVDGPGADVGINFLANTSSGYFV